MPTVTIDMKSGLYPREAADAFLGNHVFVATTAATVASFKAS
jgi:hypothetical protein